LSAAIILAESGQRRRKVILRLLDIQPPAGATTTGSGLVVSGLLDAVLDRSRISRFRYSGAGGGVIVAGGDLLLTQSEISDNFGSNGGGLFCSNGSVELDAASRLLLNVANGVGANVGHGGGAYLEDCDLRSSGRVLPAALGGTSGIIGNRATQSGGGIYADHSLVHIHGGPLCGLSDVALCQPRLAIVALNRAGSKGGGLALHNSEAFIDFTQISQNEAVSEGGGIHVADDSNVRFGGLAALYPNYDRSHCHEARLCDAMIGNRLHADAVFTGADLYFADNAAAAGNSLHASGTASTLLVQVVLKQVELAANTLGLSAFEFSDTSITQIRGATLLSWHDQNVIVRAEGSATLNLRESLVGTFVAGDFSLQGVTNSVTTGECNAHIGATNRPGVFAVQADASDLDALDPIAPALAGHLVDTCASAAVDASARDIYGRPRVARVSAAAPGQLLDIGALEAPTQLLFASSFE
jgi:predicted outer membrane repeat protein